MLKRKIDYTRNGNSYTAEPTGRTLGIYQEWNVSRHYPERQNQPAMTGQERNALISIDATRTDALAVLLNIPSAFPE